MTPAQIDAAALIQSIAEEMAATDKRRAPNYTRRNGRRLLEALEALTEPLVIEPKNEADPWETSGTCAWEA